MRSKIISFTLVLLIASQGQFDNRAWKKISHLETRLGVACICRKQRGHRRSAHPRIRDLLHVIGFKCDEPGSKKSRCRERSAARYGNGLLALMDRSDEELPLRILSRSVILDFAAVIPLPMMSL